MFNRHSISRISLDSAGLVALADIKSISYRTILMGYASYFDVLVLAPGIHVQQSASELNGNECPRCADINSGYAFHVENPAMVAWLQNNGKPGTLTVVKVSEIGKMLKPNGEVEQESDAESEAGDKPVLPEHRNSRPPLRGASESSFLTRVGTLTRAGTEPFKKLVGNGAPRDTGPGISTDKEPEEDAIQANQPNLPWTMRLKQRGTKATILYFICCILTAITITLLAIIHDWWAIGILGMLMAARLINTTIIRKRADEAGWKGAKEPGVESDLLVLVSQDRWFRIQGYTNDVKAVTAGQWLREKTHVENGFASFAILLVFGAAALASNSSTIGSLMVALLLLVTVGLLGLCNDLTPGLCMYGRFICIVGKHEEYKRRLKMVKDIISKTGKSEWALSMGLIKKDQVDSLLGGAGGA